uniref:Bystin n=2 Tax=Parascaris univalens TaxID=6257 RepID=A0A915B6Y6_PARUN
MGRKIKSGAGDLVGASALPLDQQIERSNLESPRDTPRIKQRNLKRAKSDDEYISGDLSAKILSTARKQRLEEEGDEVVASATVATKRMRKVSLGAGSDGSVSDDEDHASDFEDYDDSVVVIDPKEEAAIEKFLIKKDERAQKTLFEIIQEKIDQKKFEIETRMSQNGDDLAVRKLDPEVIDMYRQVGTVLSTYRSGKIPKAFKIIPKMINWEQLLYLTNPDKWSAAAMYQATRMFASNLNAKLCQRFYRYVLLPRLRDDIDEYKKLNFHLYQALHKATYKPQAFFKGIILPLCESGTCTLREATIFGSVLTKSSLPMLHAAVAMLKISEMEYTGANSLFLRILIDKKYTLPYRALDGIVKHFLRFRKDERHLPVLWQQSFLAFAQRYKNDISEKQREALLEIVKVHHHYQISPEIRRELLSVEREKSVDNESAVPDDGMEF